MYTSSTRAAEAARAPNRAMQMDVHCRRADVAVCVHARSVFKLRHAVGERGAHAGGGTHPMCSCPAALRHDNKPHKCGVPSR
ncbi:hypothetical protein EON67_02280 [archaeon]|nr:MAG: hypothetical protein EON67_02280 [archaeon]